ncbi:MAG: hypothetical protein RIR70_1650 [Pseudomonadota bacterium]|jgi:FtsZ-interacting cell division protein ZipA
MDKLQFSLITLGLLGLIGLYGYSKWQESRARRHAENVFGAEHRDVLLDDSNANKSSEVEPVIARVGQERIEPVAERLAVPQPSRWEEADAPSVGRATLNPTVLRSAMGETVAPNDPAVETLAEPISAEPAASAEPAKASAANVAPRLPQEVNEHVDCVLRFEPDSPVSAGDVLSAYAQHWPQPVPGLRWFGLPVGSNSWRALVAGSQGQYSKVVASVQLASRAGAVSDEILDRFLDGARKFAETIDCPVVLPDSRMVAHQASELDRFCASVDVLIGVNVLAHEHPFPGTKIRGLAEAAGMKLGADGVYRAFDEDGSELFGLASLEATPFSAESLRSMQTRGLTLMLDVPRAAHGKQAFERMLLLARQLAEALKGRLVDDNQAPLAEGALSLIRDQIGKFQKQMTDREIPPGSAVALRVFS